MKLENKILATAVVAGTLLVGGKVAYNHFVRDSVNDFAVEAKACWDNPLRYIINKAEESAEESGRGY